MKTFKIIEIYIVKRLMEHMFYLHVEISVGESFEGLAVFHVFPQDTPRWEENTVTSRQRHWHVKPCVQFT